MAELENGSAKAKGKGKTNKSKSKAKNKNKGQDKHVGGGKAECLNSGASFTMGTAVQLLDETMKVVGNGCIASQSLSHGRDIPFGYLNVEMASIASNVQPFHHRLMMIFFVLVNSQRGQ